MKNKIKYSDLSTWNDWDIEVILDSYAERISKCKSYQEKDEVKERYVKLIKLQVINDGHIMTIENFANTVKCGGFNAYDGCGVYMDANGEESDIYVSFDPDDILSMKEQYPYVAWYNK